MDRSNEFAIQIIDSIEGKNPRRVYANVKNNGLITNLPNGCCVEVPCLVDQGGLNPFYVGDLPEAPAALCRNAVNLQELAVLASTQKKRKLVYQALALDPLTATVLTLDEIWKMADEMFEVEKRWLPSFG